MGWLGNMNIFKYLPLIEYKFPDDADSTFIRNFFIRFKILDYINSNPKYFTTIVLNGTDRPDTIAYKIYGDSNLFWLVLMVNNIIDPYDWIMKEDSLDDFINSKYQDNEKYNIHHTERNGKTADYRAATIMINKKPFGTLDSDPDSSYIDPTTYQEVTNQDFESAINDSKRIIRLIRPEYLDVFLSDVQKQLNNL